MEVRKGKETKVPYNARTWRPASSTDSATWVPFDEAVASHESAAASDGIGFVFTPNDPYAGVDLDNCLGDDGRLAGWAAAILEHFPGAYVERSPSGHGLKLFVRGGWPNTQHRKPVPVGNGARVEVYDRVRYFTVTGDVWGTAPRELPDATEGLAWLASSLFLEPAPKSPEPSTNGSNSVDDDALLDAAHRASNGSHFGRLWRGEWDAHEYDSQSEADLALCNLLAFWIGPDARRIDQLFRRSGLMRGKWNERRGESTYGQDTIAKVLGRRTEFYSPPGTARAGADKTVKRTLFNTTDIGNAERLVALHGHDLRYVYPFRSWLIWDGHRWQRDAAGEVERRAKETVRAILQEADDAGDDHRRELIKHALRSEADARIRAMIERARSELPVSPDQLDADPWLINVLNGTVDLRTGALRPNRRGDLCTKLAPVGYRPDATHVLWPKFLEEQIPDPATRVFVQRAVGYSISGDTREEVLFFVHGPTSSGKSTFTEAVGSALGDYRLTADFEAFLRRRGDGGIRNDIARLAGARMVLSLEVDEGRRLAEALIKNLTGGDVVTARFLRREFFDFRPTFKLWLVANAMPRANAYDAAMWRRILLVPFTTSVPPERRSPAMKAMLLSDPDAQAAVLAWAVKGCLAWQRDGLDPPDAVRRATEAYRHDCDHVGTFLGDSFEGGNTRISAGELRQRYEGWCKQNGEHPLSTKPLAAALEMNGWRSGKSHNGRFWERSVTP